MKELQRKQIIRRIMYSVPTLVVLSVLTLLILKGAVGMFMKERESAQLTRDLEDKAIALAYRKEDLEKGIERLKTEEGIKEEIKDRFSVTQEGEYVAIIVDERTATTSQEEMGSPWYRKFWNAIMGE